jgi:predicted CoA-substrate-specific enzyme activase
MICAGIDAGSRAIKVVLLDGNTGQVLSRCSADQLYQPGRQAQELFEQALAAGGLTRRDVRRVVATGYARAAVQADTTVTEITCHAIGVRHTLPAARTVVEIGGQDSKLLRLDPDGRVRDFAMNDRCAAGTGRFLEMVAARLGVPVGELGRMAQGNRCPAAISSMCAVFAETEIIGLLASGRPQAEIIAGVQAAVAARVAAMAGGRVTRPVAFTGGVAQVDGMAGALEQALGQAVIIPDNPQYTGALGAALAALRQIAP